MTRGVAYLLCGMPAAERLTVSIWSLRKHYGGPVTVFVTTEQERAFVVGKLKPDLDVEPLHLPLRPEQATKPMLVKTLLPQMVYYDETVFLDADTLVTGPIDELYGHRLTLTQYSNRTTRCRLPGRWIRAWLGINDEIDGLVRDQIERPRPFINSGVFAFERDNPDLVRWRKVALANRDARMVDELALQLLTSEVDHRLVDDRFNRCPSWGRATEDIRVWHFHGRRHCSAKARCSAVWCPAFLEARAEDVAGLARWAGYHDKKLRSWLRKHKEQQTV